MSDTDNTMLPDSDTPCGELDSVADAYAGEDVSVEPSRPTLGWGLVVAGLALIAVSIVGSLIAFDQYGRSSRVPLAAGGAPEVLLAPTGPAAVLSLESRGVRGARVLEAGRQLSAKPVDLGGVVTTNVAEAVYPPPALDAAAAYRSLISTDNYLYVATRLGVARRLERLTTMADFTARLEAGEEAGVEGAQAGATAIHLNENGETRFVYATLPRIDDDIVLLVNASYFLDGTPEQLRQELRKSGARLGLVVIVTDEGDPTVDDAARDKAVQFGELIAGGL